MINCKIHCIYKCFFTEWPELDLHEIIPSHLAWCAIIMYCNKSAWLFDCLFIPWTRLTLHTAELWPDYMVLVTLHRPPTAPLDIVSVPKLPLSYSCTLLVTTLCSGSVITLYLVGPSSSLLTTPHKLNGERQHSPVTMLIWKCAISSPLSHPLYFWIQDWIYIFHNLEKPLPLELQTVPGGGVGGAV